VRGVICSGAVISPPSSHQGEAAPGRRQPSLTVSLLVFAGLVWLAILCLEPATRLDWLGPVPRQNLELGIDARALFYTEIDIDTNPPVVGMMGETAQGTDAQ
jgi:hypothetical protein